MSSSPRAAPRRAAARAYYAAGIRDVRQVGGLVCELHDAFNSLLPLNLVDLGLVPAHESIDALVGSGRGDAVPLDPYANPHCGPHGRLPVNMSGGLKSRGHPVGGTGLFQLSEVWLQLVRQFPTNLTARFLLDAEVRPTFQAESGAQKAPEVEF